MTVIRVALLPLVSLLLTMLFNASGCSSKHDDSPRNSISHTALNLTTSCGQRLCLDSPNYSASTINHAVGRVRRILRSEDPFDAKMKEKIHPVVIAKFSAFQGSYRQTKFEKPDGCREFTSIDEPKEGYSIDDGEIYYVVNVPDYQQSMVSINCTSCGKVCDKSGKSTCQQDFHEYEFLVVPIDTEFDISDFRVRKFRKPNGCVCSKFAY